MINIKIMPNSPTATVNHVKSGVASTKEIFLKELFSFFQTIVPTAKDTGYLSPTLIREFQENNICTRIYYYKEFTTDLKYRHHRIVFDNFLENPYGINISRRDNDDRRIMTIPNFVFRDVVGYTKNNLSATFNVIEYRVGMSKPNMVGRIDGSCPFGLILPNQYDDRICWPTGTPVDTFLSIKDSYVQTTFITRYLTSMFNSDLNTGTIDLTNAQPYIEGFYTFLRSINTSTIPATLPEFITMCNPNDANFLGYPEVKFLFKFYMMTILKQNTLSIFSTRRSITINDAITARTQ